MITTTHVKSLPGSGAARHNVPVPTRGRGAGARVAAERSGAWVVTGRSGSGS